MSKSYKALRPLEMGRRRYEAGAVVGIEDEREAESLIADGALEAVGTGQTPSEPPDPAEPDGQQDAPPAEPDGQDGAEPEPLDALAAACGQLTPGNAEHFTRDGKPQIAALAAIADRRVSAAERDAAWAMFRGADEQRA